jgi:LCP family protein required for cell wall assembly
MPELKPEKPGQVVDQNPRLHPQEGDKSPMHKRSSMILVVGILGFCLVFSVLLLLWFRQAWQTPLAEGLDLVAVSTHPVPVFPGSTAPSEDPILPDVPTTPVATKIPLCGDESEWLVELAGLDYAEPDPGYLYGLADVVRVARVDFTSPRVNIISLPRALLVNVPGDHFLVPGPMLLNQTYFFGARGMGSFTGSGYGAGSLAETLQYNFGISIDHYLVVNFQAFVGFIDAIGGIDIDLPTFVDDRPSGYFPPGRQHLDGERTLYLARIREKYSDLVRITDQSLIIEAIFQKLKDPAILTRLPSIYGSLKNSIISDVSPEQIEVLFCLFDKLEIQDLHFYDPGWDLLVDDREYIPTLKFEMEILRWDQNLVDWLYRSLYSQ